MENCVDVISNKNDHTIQNSLCIYKWQIFAYSVALKEFRRRFYYETLWRCMLAQKVHHALIMEIITKNVKSFVSSLSEQIQNRSIWM